MQALGFDNLGGGNGRMKECLPQMMVNMYWANGDSFATVCETVVTTNSLIVADVFITLEKTSIKI